MKSCLIIISLFSGISVFSQNSFDVLKPTRVVNIENSDQYMQKLFTGARAYQNSDTYSKSTITKVQDPNIDVVTTNIQNNPKYNNIVTYLNKTTNEYFSYLVKLEESAMQISSTVFDSVGAYISSTTIENNQIVFSDLPGIRAQYGNGRSIFSDCMDAKEEEFEDSFSGWILWNTSATTQVTAAIFCQGCAKRWWRLGCP